MTIEAVLMWLVIGLIAGVLAHAVVGGGFGLVGDIVAGIAGAFVGGYIFDMLDISSPFGGIIGTIIVAFVGAVVILGLLRLVRRGRVARV